MRMSHWDQREGKREGWTGPLEGAGEGLRVTSDRLESGGRFPHELEHGNR